MVGVDIDIGNNNSNGGGYQTKKPLALHASFLPSHFVLH